MPAIAIVGDEMEKMMVGIMAEMMDVAAAGQGEADRLGIEFEAPPWIGSVPKGKRKAAIRRYMGDLLSLKKRRGEAEGARVGAKLRMASVISDIEKAGYRVTFFSFMGYGIAIAYQVSDICNVRDLVDVDCFFSVCSASDTFSRYEARVRLMGSINEGDLSHSFFCTVPGRCKCVTDYVRRRFLERAETDSTGLPYDMVKAVR